MYHMRHRETVLPQRTGALVISSAQNVVYMTNPSISHSNYVFVCWEKNSVMLLYSDKAGRGSYSYVYVYVFPNHSQMS